MEYVSNNVYLELAKLDYNNCQALHQREWDSMQKWYLEMNLDDFGVTRRSLVLTYFIAAASIFEPERNLDANRTVEKLMDILLRTLNHLSSDAFVAHGRDISSTIRRAWEKWMMKWVEEGDRHQGVAELLVLTINLSGGRSLLSHPKYQRLSNLTNSVSHQLCQYQKQKVQENGCYDADTDNIRTQKIDAEMQELVQLVLESSSDDDDDISSDMKQTFLTVTRSFYYAAHCDLDTITFHIAKVLFEKVR
ncbi:hypothetical protein CCACVL1_04800 [Corchorus capsularis]|uniref:Uncharacterized protein n=1 Tax=Corchorus capsularis TaxID=210143 RepID=A0A1R3JPI6_COCAP|nr:hypothetical protein CCACVL1_04800 [Corchorus capsularis]